MIYTESNNPKTYWFCIEQYKKTTLKNMCVSFEMKDIFLYVYRHDNMKLHSWKEFA